MRLKASLIRYCSADALHHPKIKITALSQNQDHSVVIKIVDETKSQISRHHPKSHSSRFCAGIKGSHEKNRSKAAYAPLPMYSILPRHAGIETGDAIGTVGVLVLAGAGEIEFPDYLRGRSGRYFLHFGGEVGDG